MSQLFFSASLIESLFHEERFVCLIFFLAQLEGTAPQPLDITTNIAAYRDGGKAKKNAGRLTVQRDLLNDRTTHLRCTHVRNNTFKQLFHAKDDGAWRRPCLGSIVALHVRSRCVTNPRDRQRIQRRKEVRTARRAPLHCAASRCDVRQTRSNPDA